MSLFHRVRGRFPGFQATADVDPHEWRLPSYSYASPSSPKSPTNKALKRASTGFIIGGGGSNSSSSTNITSNGNGNSSNSDDNTAQQQLIPDPAIFRNAFVPLGNTAGADADNGVSPEGDRLTYPDIGHGAVHLALLECFAGLRRQARRLPTDVDGHGIRPPSYESHSRSPPHSRSPDADEAAAGSPRDVDSDGSAESRSLGTGSENAVEDGDVSGDGDEGLGSHADGASRDEEARRRWDLFVRLAVTRFGVWWANIDKILNHAEAYIPSHYHRPPPGAGATDRGVVQLTADYLPPLDVLMVWYAFMLLPPSHSHQGHPPYSHEQPDTAASTTPSRFTLASAASPSYDPTPYDEACRARPDSYALTHLCFPWPAIRDVLDLSTTSPSCLYRLPKAAENLFFTLTGQPADLAEYLMSPPAYSAHDVAVSFRFGGGGHHHLGVDAAAAAEAEPCETEVTVNLVDAVKQHVDPFVAHAADLDWLRGPALPGSLDRSLQAYTDELIAGGEQEDALLWDGADENVAADARAAARPTGLPFGVELAWRTHRLYPAQYRVFCERGGVAALRHAAATAAFLEDEIVADLKKKGGQDSNGSDHQQQRKRRGGRAEICCACWTCERVRDDAPAYTYAYDEGVSVPGSESEAPCYDPDTLRGLSQDQIRAIRDDLAFCYAARDARRRGLPPPTAARAPARIAGRILKRGVKVGEVRRWSTVLN